MRFVSLKIKEGLFERSFSFSDGFNLIHSDENTRGKTTLLRFLLYSIGYPIPSTRNISFETCEVESVVECGVGTVTLIRIGQYGIDAIINGERRTYILPSEQYNLQGQLFSTENTSILNNLLGAFYLDQEKGWTLLNRGKVIGSISFNIEELIRGLSGRNCDSLLAQQKKLEADIKRYRQLLSISQFREEIIEEQGSVLGDDYSEQEKVKTEALVLERDEVRAELRRINDSIRDNKSFINFISSMRIFVRSSTGEEIPVTPDSVVGYNDHAEILEARKRIISERLAKICRQLEMRRKEQVLEDEQLSFFTTPSMLEITSQKIARIPLDAIAIQRTIDGIEKQLREIRQKITNSTKTNNAIVDELYQVAFKYAEELNLTKEKQFREFYLFTSNLKELSGAILHKTVFAFRLAYIIAIEKAIGIKLPIILDSPSGKEVDQKNIAAMFHILRRDFADHQIVIASIYEYDLSDANRIEIVNRLIE